MRLLVVGCKLQGIEVISLAQMAGFFVTGVDHNREAIGSRLPDRFVCADVFDARQMLPLFWRHDVVLPTVEDAAVCQQLVQYGEMTHTPVIFSPAAYAISSSKQRSNDLFCQCNLPMPQPYPACGFPVIVKPDDQSGSSQVQRIDTPEQLKAHCQTIAGTPIIQQYLEGRSFSLEVLRMGGKVSFPMITEVRMDGAYDCNRIVAPAVITPAEQRQFLELGEALSQALPMDGIFDIEVISHHGTLKLLEIDARFPSQTPLAVYFASGFNMVEWLVRRALGENYAPACQPSRVCWYQQIVVTRQRIQVLGEHVMTACGPLHRETDFFGAPYAVTDYTEDWEASFSAILILYGDTTQAVAEQMQQVYAQIRQRFSIPFVEDPDLSALCQL